VLSAGTPPQSSIKSASVGLRLYHYCCNGWTIKVPKSCQVNGNSNMPKFVTKIHQSSLLNVPVKKTRYRFYQPDFLLTLVNCQPIKVCGSLRYRRQHLETHLSRLTPSPLVVIIGHDFHNMNDLVRNRTV